VILLVMSEAENGQERRRRSTLPFLLLFSVRGTAAEFAAAGTSPLPLPFRFLFFPLLFHSSPGSPARMKSDIQAGRHGQRLTEALVYVLLSEHPSLLFPLWIAGLAAGTEHGDKTPERRCHPFLTRCLFLPPSFFPRRPESCSAPRSSRKWTQDGRRAGHLLSSPSADRAFFFLSFPRQWGWPKRKDSPMGRKAPVTFFLLLCA